MPRKAVSKSTLNELQEIKKQVEQSLREIRQERNSIRAELGKPLLEA